MNLMQKVLQTLSSSIQRNSLPVEALYVLHSLFHTHDVCLHFIESCCRLVDKKRASQMNWFENKYENVAIPLNVIRFLLQKF